MGLFVVSRVKRTNDLGDVVQCVKDVPSDRMTFCGNLGTIGFGNTGGRRFQTCVRPYGELDTALHCRGIQFAVRV